MPTKIKNVCSKEYKGLDLTGLSAEVLESWKKTDVFHKTLEMRQGSPEYVFFEGPPSANGMPGIHHVMARSIKDVICRYKTQSGWLVNRKAGWDTHGLPVELGVEKMLGITERRHRQEDLGSRIQFHLQARGHEIYKGVGKSYRTHRLIGWIPTILTSHTTTVI